VTPERAAALRFFLRGLGSGPALAKVYADAEQSALARGWHIAWGREYLDPTHTRSMSAGVLGPWWRNADLVDADGVCLFHYEQCLASTPDEQRLVAAELALKALRVHG
jgi:hypothetical protein